MPWPTIWTYLGRGDSVENNVKLARILGGPVGVGARRNVPIAPQVQRILSLVVLPRDADNLVRPERLGKQDGEVPQATDAHYSNPLAGPSMEPLQRRVNGCSGAEHGRGKLGRQTRRYLDDKV